MEKALFCLVCTASLLLSAAFVTAGGQADMVTVAEKQLVEIEVVADLQWKTDPMKSDEFVAWNELAKKEGFTIKFTMPPHSGYRDKIGVLFASGDLPDVVWDDLLEDRQASGYLVALDRYIAMPEHAAKLDQWITEELWAFARLGGQTWGLPAIRHAHPQQHRYPRRQRHCDHRVEAGRR